MPSLEQRRQLPSSILTYWLSTIYDVSDTQVSIVCQSWQCQTHNGQYEWIFLSSMSFFTSTKNVSVSSKVFPSTLVNNATVKPCTPSSMLIRLHFPSSFAVSSF